MAWYMVWPDGHGMLYGMTWMACHGLWYDLAGMQSIWYDLAGMVYGMAWCAWLGIWYGLAGIVWCTVWPDRHCMVHGVVYGMA